MGYPRFFTPNNDGYNDTWNIIDGGGISVTKVIIYDRYGKLIKQINPGISGWDGTFNSRPMPADDYWFVVDYTDSSVESMQQFKGHFTLKR
ncbi:T9SS type B sorting domain-containing protein [Antarcticibacterium arcticum]|uniref:T9SS type B sorting domain-containing protein n=1 Tax=Antarcticibacterium arcticum TaxID=2585771 RepID=UPI0021D0F5B5|nr:T9SS type B sorting domain-containing protein [Antarcticibacterium arcticum]